MNKDEIRKLVNSGKITFDQFTENSDMVFAVIKERHTEIELTHDGMYVMFNDKRESFKVNKGEMDHIAALMNAASSSVDKVEDLLQFLIDEGTNKSLMTFFFRLMKTNNENAVLKQVLSSGGIIGAISGKQLRENLLDEIESEDSQDDYSKYPEQ